MKALAIDTSTEILSVSLEVNEKKYHSVRDTGLRHAERLMGIITSLLADAEITIDDLDFIACARGPGSFTGLRIGLSAVKGLSAGTGVPIITVVGLDCMAAPFSHLETVVMPVIDARKERFYTALYRHGQRISDFHDIPISSIHELCSEFSQVIITGPHALRCGELIVDDEKKKFRIDPLARRGSSESLLKIAKEQYRRGEFSSDNEGPLYVRPPEVRMPLS